MLGAASMIEKQGRRGVGTRDRRAENKKTGFAGGGICALRAGKNRRIAETPKMTTYRWTD